MGRYRDEGGTLEEIKSSRREKICTQIILKKHKVPQDMRKENIWFDESQAGSMSCDLENEYTFHKGKGRDDT